MLTKNSIKYQKSVIHLLRIKKNKKHLIGILLILLALVQIVRFKIV
jgi:hypothetical protein